MRKVFAQERLDEIVASSREAYQGARPFPHFYQDTIIDTALANEARSAFPSLQDDGLYRYESPFEGKVAMDRIDDLPGPIATILQDMNSPRFLQFLEALTGIDGLVPDPYLRGGGVHISGPGGKLGIHTDFNVHPKLRLYRRVNALLYLSDDWEEEYGGHLELWSGRYDDSGKKVLDECEARITPIFNRLAVFSLSNTSFHGFPHPITSPEGVNRKSLATYYYTTEPSAPQEVEPHSTQFYALPGQEITPELQEVMDRRSKGRLTTNVKKRNTVD